MGEGKVHLAWGGEEEQAAEKAAGNRFAKNWQDEAVKVLETMVSTSESYLSFTLVSVH